MQRVMLINNMTELEQAMNSSVLQYIGESQIESFESFDTFNLLAFDWYDIHSERTEISKIIIYMDKKDLLFICRDGTAENFCRQIVKELTAESEITNEKLLSRFFIRLFWGDMDYLDRFEAKINNAVTEVLSGKSDNSIINLVLTDRQELLRLKHYYEQIDTIFDEIIINDNCILTQSAVKRLSILGSRTDRYLSKVYNLQDLVGQMQETYQAQLSIKQNDLMKFFTIITAIFLPLTLLTGWYGMNFSYMPELHWRFAYPLIIAVSGVVIFMLIWYFKHKKWL